MSASTAQLDPAMPPRLELSPEHGGGFWGAVRSEWTKLWSVATTWWTLATATVLMLGGVALAAVSTRAQHAEGDAQAFTTSAPFVAGEVQAYLTQWAVIILSVLIMTSEYQTGTIRATLQWVPVRGRVLLAKLAVLVPVLGALGFVMGSAALGIAILGLGEYGESYTIDDAYNAVLGVSLYFPMIGMFGLGLATLLRGPASTMAVVFVVLLILPIMLPAVNLETVAAYLPGDAGATLMHGARGDEVYPRPVSALIVLAWAVAAMVAGWLALARRDA